MSVLEMAGVWFGYEARSPVLQGVSLSIAAGETVGLLGRNGAGKTTLTKLMVGLLHPSRGDVHVGGLSTRGLAPEDIADRTAYVFQHADQQLFSSTVLGEVEFGPRQLGRSEPEIDNDVEAALEAVGLDFRREVHPYDLPPAERKLVALAAALAQRPRLLVLDEPTQGLDRTGRSRVVAALHAFAGKGGAVVAVTHDLGFVAEALERAVVLHQGAVAADEPARKLVADAGRARGLGLIAPVTAQISAALNLPGSPVRFSEVVAALGALRAR